MSSTMQSPFQAGIRDSRDRLGLRGPYDLGVLLVHGIGEQKRGDTLTSQGDPFVKWLRGRVRAGDQPDDPKVDVLDSVVRQASTDAIPAAHAVIRITPGARESAPGIPKPALWVVAEAWWAESFRQATYSELMGWAISAGPFVFATEVSGIARRMEIADSVPKPMKLALIPITLIVGAALVLVAAVVGFLVTVLAIALVLVALTRLPFFADAARSLQENIASGFGDAYVLTRSPLRFAAMAGQVRDGLQALRRECKSVVVIAESMGTAVAWYALKHELTDPDEPQPVDPDSSVREPAPVRLWLTHGQALRKLTFVLRMALGKQTGRQTALAIGTAALLGVAVVAFYYEASWPLVVVPIIAAVTAEIVLMKSALTVWEESGEEIKSDWLKVRRFAPDLDWLDLWASADPFALGPLGVDDEWISSYKIRNVGSPLADHTSYWTNTTEFLPIVASYLFRLGGPAQYAAKLDDPRLEVSALRRHARVMALIPHRFVVGLGLGLGLLYAWLHPEVGRALTDFVGALNLPLVDGFFDDPPDWVVALAGYAFVAVLGVLAWSLVNLLWNGLLKADERTYFDGTSPTLWSVPWSLFMLLIVPNAVAIALTFLVLDEPLLSIGFTLGAIFLSALGLAVLSGGGKTYAYDEKTDRASRTLAASTAITGNRVGVGITVLIAMALVAVPLVTWLWFRDAFPVVIAVEILALSLVLAAEAIREYLVFHERFEERNLALRKSMTAAAGDPSDVVN